MKIFTQSIFGAALLAGGAAFTIRGQGLSGSIAVGQVSTNGIVRQPRDPAAEIAFNPFLQLKTNAQGKVLFDYQYRSTNATVPLSQSIIEIHSVVATGRNGRHTVHFRANLKDEDAIVIVMPDNQILQGRLVALSVSDEKGSRVWLGELQDCQGEVVGERANQVLYRRAFKGILADVKFDYDLNYIEQSVILRQRPVLPAEIDEATARLEVWTAFSRAPEPRKLVTQVDLRQGNPGDGRKQYRSDDGSLDFGSMRMVAGQAFKTGSEDPPDHDAQPKTPVVKRWFRDAAWAYLSESADYLSLKSAFQTLEPYQARAGSVTSVTNLAFLAAARNADSERHSLGATEARPKALLMALAASGSVKAEPGILVDYRLVTTSLLNINFGTIERTGPAAAGKSSSDYWNLFNTAYATFGTLDNLLWSDGTGSGTQLVLENCPGVWGNSTGDGMMDGYVYPWSYVENGTVRLNNIPPGIYDFYVYGAWGGVGAVNGNYVLSVAGQAFGQRQTVLGPNWAALNWTEGEHYVFYPNVAVGSGQQVSIVAMPGGDVALFNGLQMVATGSGNAPPTISNIPDQTIPKYASAGPTVFNVNDGETPANALTVTASSGNQALVPNANIALGGSGYARTITVTPVWGMTGSATITVTVSDGSAQASDSFLLTVSADPGYFEVNKAYMRADASTTGFGWLPQYAINGATADPGWHNEEGRTPGTDWLRVDLGSSLPVGRVQYYPREYADNGTFLEYSIYVTDNASTDMNSWGTAVSSGSWAWPNGAELKTLDFTPKWGRYVIFRCLRGANYDRYASGNEVWVYSTQSGEGPDSDADGLADAWEFQFFGNTTSQNGSGDPDGDGLTNLQEYQGGTNPIVANTDGDSLPNGWEFTYFGNITSQNDSGDPDADGLTNQQEYQGGYNPTQWDTNGNGVSDGYEDYDGDGLANLMEGLFGTNPWSFDNVNGNGIADWKEDSDGDGLPDAYERNVSLTNPSFAEASPLLPNPLDKCPIDP